MFGAAFVCNRYKLMCTASAAFVAKKLYSSAVLLMFHVLRIMASVMVSSHWHLTLTSPLLWLLALALLMCSFMLPPAVSTVSSRYRGDSQVMCIGIETCLLEFFGWQGTTPLKLFCCSSKLICPLCQSKQPLFNFLHEMKIICSKRVQILFTMACLSTSA